MDSELRSHIVNNAFFRTWRKETVGDKAYLVVKGVPLVEGVLNGRYVSADEFGAFVKDWDGVPVVMRHPKTNDGSARVASPDVPIVGRFYNAELDGTRLVGEFWLEEDALNSPDGETVITRMKAQLPIELSTGYYAESVPSVGKWNGKEYNLVDQNLHPDHIALLPDEVGACSLDDGCGLNRNRQMSKQNAEHPWHKGRPGKVGGSRSDESDVDSESANTARSLTKKADQATKRAMESGDPKDHAAARDAHAKAAEANFQVYFEIKKDDPEAAEGFYRAVFDHERTAEIHNKHAGKLKQNVTGLSGKAAEMWEEIYQAALKEYDDEAKAAATAWEAVKRKYRKDKDTGKWVLRENSTQPKQNTLDITPQEAEGLAALVAFVAD